MNRTVMEARGFVPTLDQLVERRTVNDFLGLSIDTYAVPVDDQPGMFWLVQQLWGPIDPEIPAPIKWLTNSDGDPDHEDDDDPDELLEIPAFLVRKTVSGWSSSYVTQLLERYPSISDEVFFRAPDAIVDVVAKEAEQKGVTHWRDASFFIKVEMRPANPLRPTGKSKPVIRRVNARGKFDD